MSEELAAIVAAVQAEPILGGAEEEPRDLEPESQDSGLRDDECMYCRGALILPRIEEYVCDTCHYQGLTVEARVERVEAAAAKIVATGQGDFLTYEAKLMAAVEEACTLAGSRDERLVRQYTKGLLDGLRIGGKLTVKEFPLESYQAYVKDARVWGD